ncbi:MAG: hypothetical protein M3Q79_02410 [bacterium]|nr:hypothetical protein [bacterium]
MYGSVLGASVSVGSVAVLPNTSGNTLLATITVATLTAGILITLVSLTKVMSAKYFANYVHCKLIKQPQMRLFYFCMNLTSSR